MDIYGYPINLRYEDSTTFKSLLGGIATIFSRILVLVYFIFEIKSMVERKSTVTYSTKVNNVDID